MMLIMNLVMVAEGMDPSTPGAGSGGSGSGSSGSGMTNTMTIGKIFGHSTKLDKANFDVWLAGLISALAGLSIGIYKSLEAVFKYLKEHGHLELDQLEVQVGTLLTLTASQRKRTINESFKEINKYVFHAMYTTLSNELTEITKKLASNQMFEDGLAAFKHIYTHAGPGSNTKRTGKQLELLVMKQDPHETVNAFGMRMEEINNALVKPVPDDVLTAIFAKGCVASEMRQHLVTKLEEKPDYTLSKFIECATGFNERMNVVHGDEVDAFFGNARQNGNRQQGRQQNGNGRFARNGDFARGRNQSGNNGTCDLCERQHHFWRNCFFVNWTKRRDNTTDEQHEQLDRKFDEFIAQRNEDVRRNIMAFRQTLPQRKKGTRVPAMQAQVQGAANEAQLQFPNVAGIDGKMAEVQTVPQNNNANVFMKRLLFFMKALLALLLSCSGIVLILSLLAQVQVTGASSASIALPQTNWATQSPNNCIRVDIPVDPSNVMRADAFEAAVKHGKRNGTSWDSCAGLCLFPFSKQTQNLKYEYAATRTAFAAHGRRA